MTRQTPQGSATEASSRPHRGRPAPVSPLPEQATSQTPAGAGRRRAVGNAVPAGSNAQYAAARAKALKAQTRRQPADPLRNQPYTDPRERVAAMRRPCACTHLWLNHWETESGRVTWCSIATAEGPCGCEKYQPQGAAS